MVGSLLSTWKSSLLPFWKALVVLEQSTRCMRSGGYGPLRLQQKLTDLLTFFLALLSGVHACLSGKVKGFLKGACDEVLLESPNKYISRCIKKQLQTHLLLSCFFWNFRSAPVIRRWMFPGANRGASEQTEYTQLSVCFNVEGLKHLLGDAGTLCKGWMSCRGCRLESAREVYLGFFYIRC